jgi:alkylated DNA nucleotide flippase Atl1
MVPRRSVTPGRSTHQGLPLFARLVLDTVDAIPRGKVMAYGDIAEYLGQGGPRLVARMMALYGHETSWWRVLRADGSCAAEVADRQLPLLAKERVPISPAGRVDIANARFIPQVRHDE